MEHGPFLHRIRAFTLHCLPLVITHSMHHWLLRVAKLLTAWPIATPFSREICPTHHPAFHNTTITRHQVAGHSARTRDSSKGQSSNSKGQSSKIAARDRAAKERATRNKAE